MGQIRAPLLALALIIVVLSIQCVEAKKSKSNKSGGKKGKPQKNDKPVRTAVRATPTKVKVGECISDCKDVPNGDYPSCKSCNEFIKCSNGYKFESTCGGLKWDDKKKRCEWTSSTCSGTKNGNKNPKSEKKSKSKSNKTKKSEKSKSKKSKKSEKSKSKKSEKSKKSKKSEKSKSKKSKSKSKKSKKSKSSKSKESKEKRRKTKKTADDLKTYCTSSGDPHTTMYDGKKVHYQGTCPYIMSKTCPKNGQEMPQGTIDFTVVALNENRKNNFKVAYVTVVKIVFGSTVIILKSKGAANNYRGVDVWINGNMIDSFPSPAQVGADGYQVNYVSGKYMEVVTTHGFTVSYDGKSKATVRISDAYKSLMCGLCGNADGKQNDFVTKEGEKVSDNHSGYMKIGDSWQVDHKHMVDDDRCGANTEPVDCDNPGKFETSPKYCGRLSKYGKSLSKDAKVDLQNAVENCGYDVCLLKSEQEKQDSVCEQLTLMFDKRGHEIKNGDNWRKDENCPACGDDEDYYKCAPEDDRSCETLNENLGTGDKDTCKEACYCKKGFIRLGTSCVRKSADYCRNQPCEFKDKYGNVQRIMHQTRFPASLGLNADCEGRQEMCMNGKMEKLPNNEVECTEPNSACRAQEGGETMCLCEDGFTEDKNKCVIPKRQDEVINDAPAPAPAPKRFECQAQTNFVFVMDNGPECGQKSIAQYQQFVKNMEDRNPKANFKYVQFNKDAELVKQISKLKFKAGDANIEAGLETATDKTYLGDSGAVIVITDDASRAKKAVDAASALRNMRSQLMFITVGDLASVLDDLVNKPDLYNRAVRNYGTLPMVTDKITEIICSNPIPKREKEDTPAATAQCGTQRDIAVLMDVAPSCGKEAISKMVSFVKKFASQNTNADITLIGYSKAAQEVSNVGKLSYAKGPASLDKAFEKLPRNFDSKSGVIIVVSDREADNVKKAAAAAGKSGATVMTIGVGDAKKLSSLGSIASADSYNKNVRNYGTLDNDVVVSRVTETICRQRQSDGSSDPCDDPNTCQDGAKCTSYLIKKKSSKRTKIALPQYGHKCVCPLKTQQYIQQKDGTFKCESNCYCAATGDPHYKTPDGQKTDYMGTCTYKSWVVDEDFPFTENTPNFRCYHKQERRYGKTKVAFNKYIVCAIFTDLENFISIKLDQEFVISVDGQIVSLPYTDPSGRITIEMVGKNAVVSTWFGLELKWEGEKHMYYKVPGSYAGRLGGLCGNCNGNKADDLMMPDGTLTKNETLYGNAQIIGPEDSKYITDRDDKCDNTPAEFDLSACAGEEPQIKKDCDFVLDSNVFASCRKDPKRLAKLDDMAHECFEDACVTGIQDGQNFRPNIRCDIISRAAEYCALWDKAFAWHTAADCPITCTTNAQLKVVEDDKPTCEYVTKEEITKYEPPKTDLYAIEQCVCNDNYFFDNEGDCKFIDDCLPRDNPQPASDPTAAPETKQTRPGPKNDQTDAPTPEPQPPVDLTPVPETPEVNPTPVPETPVPETPDVETTPVPETPVPETPVPETPVPETPDVEPTPVPETPDVDPTQEPDIPVVEPQEPAVDPENDCDDDLKEDDCLIILASGRCDSDEFDAVAFQCQGTCGLCLETPPACFYGYEEDDNGVCVDIDECDAGTADKCDVNAKCVNNVGGYDCQCNEGYSGNGYTCERVCADKWNEAGNCYLEDVDCAALKGKCGTEFMDKFCAVTCGNCPGGVTCPSGFEAQGNMCVAVNECETPSLNTCDANSVCENTDTGFVCNCKIGYIFNVDEQECVEACKDFSDECANQADMCDSDDAATQGYMNKVCAKTCDRCGEEPCPRGYKMVDGICQDIDECEEGLDTCGENAKCDNTIGGFECTCIEHYIGNAYIKCVEPVCVDKANVKLCAELTQNDGCLNDMIANMCANQCKKCYNEPKRPGCKDGYERLFINGGEKTQVCEDINECETGDNDCTGECINLYPGFKCETTRQTRPGSISNDAQVTGPSDPTAEVADEKYFDDLDKKVIYKAKPHSLGMATGVINDADITASSHNMANPPASARPHGSGWKPSQDNLGNNYLEVDLRSTVPIHGIGIMGCRDAEANGQTCSVTLFKVQVATVPGQWTYLNDRNTNQPRIFSGPVNPDELKRHCLHLYYGGPIQARYIRYIPVGNNGCTCMRMDAYGFRAANDPALLNALNEDVWTKNTTGCNCYFDHTRNDCACCQPGGCECADSNRHQCVQCGNPDKCGTPDRQTKENMDGWTTSDMSCNCNDDKSGSTKCACCRNMGCQCGARQPNQCVQCGSEAYACGAKASIFGPTLGTCPISDCGEV